MANKSISHFKALLSFNRTFTYSRATRVFVFHTRSEIKSDSFPPYNDVQSFVRCVKLLDFMDICSWYAML